MEGKEDCSCCSDENIFYYRTDDLENRNKISDMLEQFHFEWLDMAGGQAAFYAKGDFTFFKQLIEIYSTLNNIPVYKIKHCRDPGLGLFNE